MPRTSPYRIELTDDERARLEVLARSYASPHRDVVRAKVVLLAAGGLSNEGIAVRLDIPRQIVSKWRKRFYISIIQRELLAPNDFADLKGLEARLLAFQSHYEQIAEPVEWRFTRADLEALLARLHRRTSFAIEAA